MSRPKHGLRVKFCENLGRYDVGKCHKLVATGKDGWYIQSYYGGRWYALMSLRFARERDALVAAQALTQAGLNTHNALIKANPLTVMELACRFLQW